MSCLQITAFPKYDCKPYYSVGRLPTTLNARLDTTNLVELYEFDTYDLGKAWEPTTTTMSGGTVTSTSDSCPNVGGDVSDPNAQFISFIGAAMAAAKDSAEKVRAWVVSQLPCGGIGVNSSITLNSGAVSFAQAPINSVSIPTFVPRFSGGGGGGATATCSQTIFCIGKITDSGEATLYSINSSGTLSSGPTVKIRTVTG